MEWIKCSDRLPEKSGRYITLSKKPEYGERYCAVTYYSSMYWFWNFFDYMKMDDFTDDDKEFNENIEYWMPIPKVEEKPVESEKLDASDSLLNAIRKSVAERNNDPKLMNDWLDDFAERMTV